MKITPCINCTLRNGNFLRAFYVPPCKCINCTLRNGNLKGANVYAVPDNVLIVPCGMETRSLNSW